MRRLGRLCGPVLAAQRSEGLPTPPWSQGHGTAINAMSQTAFPFDYELPRHLVAQEPLRHRTDARLMVVDRRRQSIDHHHVRDLPHLLPEGDRLVLNDTKVIPAQLSGMRTKTNGRWQGLFIEATPDGHWKILC